MECMIYIIYNVFLYTHRLYTYVYNGVYMYIQTCIYCWRGFPGGTAVKNLPASARDTRNSGSVPE